MILRRSIHWRRLGLLAGLGLLSLGLGLGLGQGSTTASTPAQVDKGLQVYQAHCVKCHAENLEGGRENAPALKHPKFTTDFADFNGLHRYIQQNMPPPNGGVLSQEEAINVAHYLYSQNGVGPDGFALPAFRQLWSVADQPVAAQQAQRSWLWGPEGFAFYWEEYVEAPGGRRLVQYFDKTRMEATRPGEKADSPGYLSNGLLATELVRGLLQKGDNTFETRAPAPINVAGDPDDAQGPTYATFNKLTGSVAANTGPVTATIDRAGTVGQNPALGSQVQNVYFVEQTGHNIPNVFWDYLNSSGPTIRDGQLRQGRLFDPWYAPVGLPITEAYWAKVKVAGQVKDVLVQCFERRCLTYTPANPEGSRVEMGNVGRHYHRWRYGQ